MSAYDKVAIARRQVRPTALDYIGYIFTDFIEFHGDRQFRDDTAVVGGIASLRQRPVTVVGIQKGKSLDENMHRNYGSPHPEGYRKALRLMKQAEKFGRPVVHFINTSGAYPGVGAEERGQGEAIARNLLVMAGLKVPIISVIIGEGGSGGALALALADQVWMLEHSVYSILSPEGFASILWKDSHRAAEAADLMKITAQDLLGMHVIERIIPEPAMGAETDFENVAGNIRQHLETELPILSAKTADALLAERYARFRKFGMFEEVCAPS